MNVGERLAEEREATGLGTVEFGRVCGVSRKAQYNFEHGENIPGGAYLIAAAAAGVDVRYVLTGERGIERVVLEVDASLLADCIVGVEAGLKAAARRMAARPRAQLIAECYGLFRAEGGASRARILEFVQRAA